MKKIKNLEIKDFNQVNKLLLNESNEFNKFTNIGWNNSSIENHLYKNNNFSLGFFHNNEILGILVGDKIPNNLDFELEIHIMFISKHMRRNNIGSSLLNYIEKNKKLNGISKIYLEVSENNSEAIKFYEKNNFVFYKFRHNYYKDNNNFINAKCYIKTI